MPLQTERYATRAPEISRGQMLRWFLEVLDGGSYVYRTRRWAAFAKEVRGYMAESEAMERELFELGALRELHEAWKASEINTATYQQRTALVYEAADYVRKTTGAAQ